MLVNGVGVEHRADNGTIRGEQASVIDFDDHRLVANAKSFLPVTLALRLPERVQYASTWTILRGRPTPTTGCRKLDMLFSITIRQPQAT